MPLNDAEREAQIRLPANWHGSRCGHNFEIADCPYDECEARESKRLLDGAQAEIARLTEINRTLVHDFNTLLFLNSKQQDEIAQIRSDANSMASELMAAQDEIARLRAPPGASPFFEPAAPRRLHRA